MSMAWDRITREQSVLVVRELDFKALVGIFDVFRSSSMKKFNFGKLKKRLVKYLFAVQLKPFRGSRLLTQEVIWGHFSNFWPFL